MLRKSDNELMQVNKGRSQRPSQASRRGQTWQPLARFEREERREETDRVFDCGEQQLEPGDEELSRVESAETILWQQLDSGQFL